MSAKKLYHCGELTYTLPQLCMLFFWLMLGGACMSLANTLPGNLLTIQINNINALATDSTQPLISDTATWIILSLIGTILNMTVCPYISVASDLLRTRWGRRIPFMIATIPPIAVALILFAFTHEFGDVIAQWAAPYWKTSPATMTALVMGLVMFLFQFFMMWINSVIWYIFIDIVPTQFFSRIMACMRLGTQLSCALFSYFLFPRLEQHGKAICFGVSAVYVIGVGLMCFFVKEGKYPPLTEEQLARKNAKGVDLLMAKLHGFREFVTCTFCNRIFVFRYCLGVAGALCGAFSVFSYFLTRQQLGLTNTHIGQMNGICGGIYAFGILVALAVATLVNRWHPTRIISYHYIFSIFIAFPLATRWIFGTLPPDAYVSLCIVNSAIYLVLSGLIAVSEQPLEMLLFPKSRYGTFCAMQAMIRSVSSLFFSFLGARVFDFLTNHFTDCTLAQIYGETWRYRLIEVWSVPCQLLLSFAAYKVYRHWARLGGYTNYAAPAPWSPGGKDPVEQLPCHPVKPEYLKKALWLYDATFLFFTILTPLFAAWHCLWRNAPALVLPGDPATHTFFNRIHDTLCSGSDPSLFHDYLFIPTIIVLLADVMWLCMRVRLYRKANRTPDGTGLLQPTLLFLFVGLHLLDKLNYLWAILQTPGKYGARLMVLSTASLIMVVLAIAVIDFMERGVKVPEVAGPTTPEIPATE